MTKKRKQKRREDGNLLPIGLGAFGIGLGIWDYLEKKNIIFA